LKAAVQKNEFSVVLPAKDLSVRGIFATPRRSRDIQVAPGIKRAIVAASHRFAVELRRFHTYDTLGGY